MRVVNHFEDFIKGASIWQLFPTGKQTIPDDNFTKPNLEKKKTIPLKIIQTTTY